MNTRRFRIAALATLVCTLGFAGLAAAKHHARGLMLGKRAEAALQKAGVDQARIDDILEQAKAHRPELIQMWQDHKAAVQQLSEMSASRAGDVQMRVQGLFEARQKNREHLRGIVEELGAQLSAREKANLVLNLAERLPKPAAECGSRLDDVLDRLEEREVLTAAEADAVAAQAEPAVAQLCGLRGELKSDLDTLRQTVANAKAGDAEIQGQLDRMKQNREAASKLRLQTLQEVVAQLSPESQIRVAGKLVRVQNAAELLLDF